MPRITGLETEYGCLVQPPLEQRAVLGRIRDWVFREGGYGLVDLEERDWDEPAGNGGFLFNGGRLYLDMGHLEYCTAECATVLDVVHADAAGDRILQRAVEALGWTGQVSIFRNNIDHHTSATFGCHENFSVAREAPFSEANVASLLTFLTLRSLFTGSGRTGQANPFRMVVDGQPPPPRVAFQITQRADHVHNDLYEWVQHNRAIINTRDEPLADPNRFRRLHLLHGDSNVLPSALFLKVGAARCVLDLLEADDLPALALADPVTALKALSRQITPPWRVTLATGRTADAVELLARYRALAVKHLLGRDAETDAVLALWTQVEEGLAAPGKNLRGLLDWPTKAGLLDDFRLAEGLAWHDPWLDAQDLEYHSIDPARSLGLALARTDGYWSRPPTRDTLWEPPPDTRAARRSRLMQEIADRGSRYFLDWDAVVEAGREPILLGDPFQA